jgi:hypothetical protein
VEGDIKAWLEYKILLYVNGESDFDIGDRIGFYAKLNDKPLVYSNRVMSEEIANGIKYSASLSANQITLIESDKTIFQEVNTFIRDSLKSGLDENEFSIAYAMLLGNSDYMDSQVLTSYRSAGVAHIFAVSGLHIGFLSVALNFVLVGLTMIPAVNNTITPIVQENTHVEKFIYNKTDDTFGKYVIEGNAVQNWITGLWENR